MTKEYALYRGDELLAIGTAKELADARGIKPETIWYYASDTYQRKAKQWKNPTGRLTAVPLDDDEDDQPKPEKKKRVPLTDRKNLDMMRQYALYRGTTHIMTGTIPEIAERRGVTEGTIRRYATPAYKKFILEKCKNPEERLVAIALEKKKDPFKRNSHSL